MSTQGRCIGTGTAVGASTAGATAVLILAGVTAAAPTYMWSSGNVLWLLTAIAVVSSAGAASGAGIAVFGGTRTRPTPPAQSSDRTDR